MGTCKHSRRGATLIEVVVAMLVLIMSATGASYFFVYGRGQVREKNHYRVAACLASEALEELKAADYTSLQAGETEAQRSIQDVLYERTVTLTDLGTYKQADVSVYWPAPDNAYHVDLTTLISP